MESPQYPISIIDIILACTYNSVYYRLSIFCDRCGHSSVLDSKHDNRK